MEKLNQIAKECNLHDIAMNLELTASGTSTKFELDVVALRGYQLFAFSCGTDTEQDGGRERLKLKLYETFARSQQLGGEEARVAIISCANDPEGIYYEMPLGQGIATRSFERGRCITHTPKSKKIKVFGRKDLLQLESVIRNWITG